GTVDQQPHLGGRSRERSLVFETHRPSKGLRRERVSSHRVGPAMPEWARREAATEETRSRDARDRRGAREMSRQPLDPSYSVAGPAVPARSIVRSIAAAVAWSPARRRSPAIAASAARTAADAGACPSASR